MDHWNASLKELKGIFMMQPLFQDSVKAWSVLHIKPERHFNRCFIFFYIDYVLLLVAKWSFKLKPRFHATAVT